MDFIEQDVVPSSHHGIQQHGGMMGNHAGPHHGATLSHFDVNLEAPFDMMSTFSDLEPSQFTTGGGGEHNPLLHNNTPGPMLSSSPMNASIKNEVGHRNNPQQQGQHTRQNQQQQQMHSMNHQQQTSSVHPHGHPHITDYSPEWGWTDVSNAQLLCIVREHFANYSQATGSIRYTYCFYYALSFLFKNALWC